VTAFWVSVGIIVAIVLLAFFTGPKGPPGGSRGGGDWI
jgi:hypothetical protein